MPLIKYYEGIVYILGISQRVSVPKHEKRSRKGLIGLAEEFSTETIYIGHKKNKKDFLEKTQLRCGKKIHYLGGCKANTPSNSGKGRQN